jgi:hypothetical protein
MKKLLVSLLVALAGLTSLEAGSFGDAFGAHVAGSAVDRMFIEPSTARLYNYKGMENQNNRGRGGDDYYDDYKREKDRTRRLERDLEREREESRKRERALEKRMERLEKSATKKHKLSAEEEEFFEDERPAKRYRR